jgi:cytochrome P450
LINSQKSQDQSDRLTSEAIIEETILILIAGSETTSNTTGFVFYELLNSPCTLAKLYKEVDTVKTRENRLFNHEQLKHLPYLNAVINETLRLNPASAATLNRITTEPMVLGDLVLPKNAN